MDSLFLNPSPVLALPSFSTLNSPKLERSFFTLKEIVDRPTPLAFQRGHVQVTSLSIGVNGNRSGLSSQRTSASGRFQKNDDEKMPDGNSSNRDEIISLFRRIQLSISKGESKNRIPKSSEEKPSAESVLDVLRQSRKQLKDNTLNERGEKVLAIRRGQSQLKNEDKTNYTSIPDVKITRPPSNFVKKSPIPFSTRSTVTNDEKGKESSATPSSEKAMEQEKVEEMKLPALKELAKSRGLKGYSKLKKSELIDLLRP